MRLGISLASAYSSATSARDGARWMIERAAAARGADLDSLFIGDHHSTGTGAYYQNTPMMGRLLAEWGDKPAGVLFLLPLWNPVLVAEQVGTLASIHQGRFIIQCAIGRDDSASPAMGVNPKYRPSMFEESLDIVRRLLKGETVSSDGRFKISNAIVSPVTPEPLEVWIGGSVSPSIDRAARLAEGWVADGTRAGNAEIAAQTAEYYERAQVHGRSPAAVAVRRNVFVGRTDEEAAAVLAPILERTADCTSMLYGSAETVAEQLKPLAEMGITDIIVRSLIPEQHRLTIESIERLAEVRERIADL